MALKDDVQAGLKAIDRPNAARPLTLDGAGNCIVPVPMPASVAQLTDGKLEIQVQMSRTGKQFSLRAGLAMFRAQVERDVLETLLQRNYYPMQTGGICYSLSPSDDALVATYHWMVDSISPRDFTTLFTRFSMGVLDMAREIATMGRTAPGIVPAHPDINA